MKRPIRKLCDKCMSECPVDKEKSNKNWTVYQEVKNCKCGGKFRIAIL